MEIYFATTNPGKVNTLKKDFEKYNISVIQEKIKLEEPRSSDVKEIAKYKMDQAYPLIKKPTIIIDAGFYIPSLNGFPRAFVNFCLETIGIQGIIKLVEKKDKTCEFKECLAYMDSTLDEPKYFMHHVRGTISDKPRGIMQNHLWSKLGLIFIPEGETKTLGEMNFNEYKNWKTKLHEKESQVKELCNWLLTKYNI